MTPEQTRELRCAEAEFEAALMAAAMAIDSDGRKIVLLNTLPYRGWQPDAPLVDCVALKKAFFRFTERASYEGTFAGSAEARWVINARLILNAWEAALKYERAKAAT